MKTTLSILLFAALIAAMAQNPQQEIDKHVWTRFTTAWETNDAAAFNAVHTEDIVRIGGRGLMIGEEYRERNRAAMSSDVPAKRTIEFAFDYRQVNGEVAYEMGFYRVKSGNSSKPYIARFHVELRKVDGVWKIARDYDSDMIGNEPVNPAMYDGLEFLHFE